MSNPEVNVTIFDTTARDGAQSLPPGNPFPIGRKIEVAHAMATLGVGVIEAGYPATPPKKDHVGPTEAEEVMQVAEQIGAGEGYEVIEWLGGVEHAVKKRVPAIAGLGGINPEDIDVVWDAVSMAKYPRIHTFVSTEENHRKAKFGVSEEEMIRMIARGVSHSRAITDQHPGATTEWSAEAASDTDEQFLEWSVKTSADSGANVINLPNTVGGILPDEAQERFTKYISWIMGINQDIVISSHEHRDLGFAEANTSLFIAEAVKWVRNNGKSINIQVETTACGIGERAGNADVFPVVAALAKRAERSDVPIRWQFNPRLSVATAQEVMSIAGLQVPRQNPIVGSDIMRHRSGIHSKGVLDGGPLLYTPVLATQYGHPEDAVHEVGRYQGRAGTAAAQANA